MPAVTFADHEGFQKTVLRASAGGAAAGLAMYGLTQLPYPLAISEGYTLVPFVCAAAAAAACGKTWKGRLAYGILGGLSGLLPWLAGSHPTFWLAAAGAGVGSLFAHFRQKETGKEISVGKTRMGKASYAAAAGLSALAILAGRAVVEAFTTRGLLEGLLPAPLIAMTITAVLAFFMSLGSAGAHVAQDPDPVEKLYAAMQPELTGDLKLLAGRAMTNYRRCAEILANSEAGFARQQLSKSLNDVTLRILELGRRWQNIDRELGERAESEDQPAPGRAAQAQGDAQGRGRQAPALRRRICGDGRAAAAGPHPPRPRAGGRPPARRDGGPGPHPPGALVPEDLRRPPARRRASRRSRTAWPRWPARWTARPRRWTRSSARSSTPGRSGCPSR
ncbi:MAG: hypothetical protein QM765_14325 [Myxococcales bacterium]